MLTAAAPPTCDDLSVAARVQLQQLPHHALAPLPQVLAGWGGRFGGLGGRVLARCAIGERGGERVRHSAPLDSRACLSRLCARIHGSWGGHGPQGWAARGTAAHLGPPF